MLTCALVPILSEQIQATLFNSGSHFKEGESLGGLRRIQAKLNAGLRTKLLVLSKSQEENLKLSFHISLGWIHIGCPLKTDISFIDLI